MIVYLDLTVHFSCMLYLVIIMFSHHLLIVQTLTLRLIDTLGGACVGGVSRSIMDTPPTQLTSGYCKLKFAHV